MKLQAVLFDFDGTLVNTERVHFGSIRTIMEPYLKEKLSDDEMNSMIGYLYIDRIRRMLALRSIDDEAAVVKLEKEARDVMRAKEKPEDLIQPGAKDFISQLHTQGITLAVVTSTSTERALRFFEPLGLSSYFTTIIGCGEVRHRKPDPEPYAMALEQLDLDPQRCIVFEDSAAGIDSARGAGIDHVIGVDANTLFSELPGTVQIIKDFTSITIEDLESLL